MIPARIAVAAVIALVTSTAVAQKPPGQPGVAGATPVPQIQLTERSAKGAIDAYLEMQEKFADEHRSPKTSAEAYAALDGVGEIVAGHGFASTGDWHAALNSVAIAYAFAKDDKNASELDASLAKIRDNPQIPDELKRQMIDMIGGVRPSPNNLTVVKALMVDAAYARKLESLGQ